MKKKIASLALIAMSLVAFPSMAENKAAKKADNTATTCAVAQRGDRPSRQACLFEGMNLTEAQQTQLQELNRQQREARKAKAEAFKKEAREAKKDLKEQKMQRDSVAMAERKAEKKAYLEKVKAIIGADNYVTFYNPQNETCNARRTKGAKIKTKREFHTKRSVPSVRFYYYARTTHFQKNSPGFAGVLRLTPALVQG